MAWVSVVVALVDDGDDGDDDDDVGVALGLTFNPRNTYAVRERHAATVVAIAATVTQKHNA
jgi:hypothetical protein